LTDLSSLIRQIPLQLLNSRGGRLVWACRQSVALDNADPPAVAVVAVERRGAAAVRLHPAHDGERVVERGRLLIQDPSTKRRVGQRFKEGVAPDDLAQLARVARIPERE
jgi:hypothetical protein